MRSDRRTLASLAAFGVLLLAGSSAAAAIGDPVPTNIAVRRQAAWENCRPPSQQQKCATLIVAFGAAIPDDLSKRILGSTATTLAMWEVRVLDISSHAIQTPRIVEAKAAPGVKGLVLLVLDDGVTAAAIDPATHTLVLTYFASERPVVLSMTGETAEDGAGGLLIDPEDPDDPDLYFAGKAKGAKGKSGVFSIEARLRRDWVKGTNEFGGSIEITAEEQGDVDPDSITAGFSWARQLSNARRGLGLAALPVAGEFSRDDPKTKGFVSTWDLTWTIVPTAGKTAELDLLFGTEVGRNFTNAINEDGSGALARGKLGLHGYLRFDRALGFHSITVDASWLARLLAKPEIDHDRLDASDDPTLTRRARHRVVVDIAFKLNERFGLALQIRGGPLPPAFEKVRRSIAASFVYKADWR
jgi:hypothetical protein